MKALKVTVADYGIGFLPNQAINRANLFDAKVEGGGSLGLYIVHFRSSLLGGFCGHSGRADMRQGSLVWFGFPYRPIVPHENAASTELRPSETVYSERKKRILVVEDSLPISKAICRSFRSEGYDVKAVFNGKEALAIIKTEHFDIILTDVQMPVMDGIMLATSIRSMEVEAQKECNVKPFVVIGMSANSDSGTRDLCITSGMNEFIAKPFDIATFDDVCHRILSNF